MEHQRLLDELVTEILVNLPVKALLRFRVVCKDWCTIIDSRNFVNMHDLSRSIQIGTNSRFLIKGFHADHGLYSVDSKSLDEAVKLNLPSWWPEQEDVVASLGGSCNGLLCLCYGCYVALWNSATKKQILLPTLTFDGDLEMYDEYSSTVKSSFGFGFDLANNDYIYKVVNIMVHYDESRNGYLDTEAKVYSLRSNSWKRVYCFPKEVEYQELGVLLKGSLHWVVNPYGMDDRSIIAFDLTKQEIQIIPIPISCNDGFHSALLYLTEGCLSISFFKADVGCDLWVLKEYEEWDSWTKLISIHDPNLLHFTQLVPIFYSKNFGELLFILYDHCNTDIFWYNFESQTTEKVPIRGLPKNFYGGELLAESLVRLDVG